MQPIMEYACLALVTSLIGFVGGSDPSEQYYKELACIPNKATNGKPQTYDCNFLNTLKDDKCYYKGKEYDVGQQLGKEDLPDCLPSCTCDLFYHSNKAYWTCVHSDCPENLGPEPCPGAVRLYNTTKSCCSDAFECEYSTKIKLKDTPTCEYNGKKYLYGEKMYTGPNTPKHDKCKICVCDEGFNGSLTEPWCRRTSCDMYLHYLSYIKDGCLPTYYTPDDCCPVPIFRCPKETDLVITPKNAAIDENNKDLKCKFGNLEMQIGQMLSRGKESGEECVECSCNTPPHPTCVMNAVCETKRRTDFTAE
ncbi:hypothetical protein GE061_011828 [Apolygus lucorum]|uniref:Uncharacterized protein n=1 Tax=Apolygus lucorum TaxID=248454 RepID=A0A6A4K9V0_APOLU|nr:hypothetical protein GE061_011828 [Apolygus lucorum]